MRITYFKEHHQQQLEAREVRDVLYSDKGALWIDVTISDETDMAFLKDTFAPHPLTLEDLYHQQQRPKAEEFADYLFVTLKPIESISADPMFRELAVFVGKNYLITVHLTHEPLLSEIEKRLDPRRTGLSMSPTYMLYVIFDAVLDGYLPALEAIETELEALGREALGQPYPDVLNRIMDLQRITNQFWWVAWPQQDIISVLTNHEMVFTEQKSLYYLRDISDHLARIMNSLHMDRDTVTNLIQIYISSVSNRLNYSVRRLTLLTIGVGIFAVFSGFYGMNFEYTWPPFDAPWGVPVALLMMVITVMTAFLLLGGRK